MKQIWIFIFCLWSVGSVWGQQETIHFDVRCEICDNNIDDDGDGFTDCADVDCILALPDGELKRESDIELRSSSCPADLGLTEEQISFIKNNTAYLESMGIHGTVAAQEEAVAIANCIASALVSATLDYSIKWFELSILQDKDLDYFALGTAQDIFSNHGVSIGGNAVLACIEGINPFKLGKIEEFLINAGFGAMSGFIEGAESEYNKFQDANCSIDDVILNKMDWGAVFSKAGTQSIITVFTVGIGARLGPIIRANTAAAAAKIKKWFGDEVWDALRNRFLKNADELFGTYLNIKDLPDDLKLALNDLSLTNDQLNLLNGDLEDAGFKAFFEDGGVGVLSRKLDAWSIINDIQPATRSNPALLQELMDDIELEPTFGPWLRENPQYFDAWKDWEKSYRSDGDPVRNVDGSGRISHPEEWNKIIEELENDGVEIVYREGGIAYSPDPTLGKPGQLIIDPDASLSALKHEYNHILDDKAKGWWGFRGVYNINFRIETEYKSYKLEIDAMLEKGEQEAVDELKANFRKEVDGIIEILGEPTDPDIAALIEKLMNL